MSTMAGFLCEKTRQLVCCPSNNRILAANYGVNVQSTTQARKSEIAGIGTKRAFRRRTVVHSSNSAPLCLAGEADIRRTRDEVFTSTTNPAGFKDRDDGSQWKEDEEYVALDDATANWWGSEYETLIQGHVGKFAFLGILLMGVGVGCLTNVGGAEAATNHIDYSRGLDVDMRALAMGPEGPLLEEFWDNMRRYGLYFVTVVTGGIYQLVKPIIDAFRNPLTAVLVIVIVSGSFYLVGLTVSAMLGINEYSYQYAP